MGTYGQRAPEIEEKRSYGIESDIYSFGMLLFELITFKPEIVDSFEILEKYEQWTHLITLAKRCVNQDPAKRPTADMIAEALEKMVVAKKAKKRRERAGTAL